MDPRKCVKINGAGDMRLLFYHLQNTVSLDNCPSNFFNYVTSTEGDVILCNV